MTYVYFIQAGVSGPVKIGRSAHPEGRLRFMQTANHERLTLLGFVPGGEEAERMWHGTFAHLCIAGEWFRPAEELLRAIFDACEERLLPR